MKVQSEKEVFTLFLGDLLSFYLALFLAQTIRFGSFPSWTQFSVLVVPFSILFLLWVVVFFASDLYGKQTAISRRNLPVVVFNAQIINIALAIIFFYFVPYFGVTPKTILFICLAVAFPLVVFWRRFLFVKIYRGRKESVLFLAKGKEVNELKEEFKSNTKYNIKVLDFDSGDSREVSKQKATIIVIDDFESSQEEVEKYYHLIFSGVRFLTVAGLYEEIFDRVSVDVINERWFLENISNQPKPYYAFLKRSFDIFVSFFLGIISLLFYPFVWLLVKLDDGGPLFFSQKRVGKNGQIFKIYKFRSMKDDQVTRVGRWLRRTRIDELPQLGSVLVGLQSLVGPRPEKPDYVEDYRKQIKFYDIRHIISPGLSGWAQIYHDNHPHFELGTEETREKLSYDLYYVKNRSLWLDIKIAIKTISLLVRRKGK